ncbi:helix-turn-helix domain-containing protein [Bradyrhizobium sp. WSM4349]|uniref:helix-turn-helix domain-containing protein n=1 Tax=Bradyrhizobium sp. WSM4349 TaxID=1040988 RepID=UPI00036D77E4|nr:helix-turn-helix domain-containing protein [Bradyrhizobium sp. WSM4349]
MSTARADRRPRRIAADEAHAWARNLRLRNLHAKMVLSMLSLYVDGDGCCFVSIPSLAEDCELSHDTVRRRLAWLESIGAITRREQWVDEYGNRNDRSVGRRTSDLIRLLLDADQELIEARALGLTSDKTEAKSTSPDPSCQPGSDQAGDSAGTRLGLGRPSHYSQGLISEPEPEPESPKAPDGGEGGRCADVDSEPEGFAAVWSAWPGHEVMRRDLALGEFRSLTVDQQRHCCASVPLFATALVKAGRTKPPNFHLWIRSRGFEEFPYAPGAAPNAPAPGPIAEGSEPGRALAVLYAVAKGHLFVHRGEVTYRGSITPQLLAFAGVADKASWRWITDRQQLAAWQAFLAAHVFGARLPLLERRGESMGFLAPAPWPPRKDGGWPESEAAQASQAGGDE